MINALIMVLLFLTSLFLILLVLVQRGRGGGLAGAFGGLGGQSAFGTKAGDLFTRITIFVAGFWIVLCAVSVKWLGEANRGMIAEDLGRSSATAPEVPGAAGAKTTKAAPGATGAKAEPVKSAAAKSSAPETKPAETAPTPDNASEKAK